MILLLCAALFQDATAARPQPLFSDVSARSLPGVETICGGVEKNWLIETQGGGVLLGDFDGDATLDLVVVDGSTLDAVERKQPGRPPRLFLGRGDGTFAPAGERWNMSGVRFGMGGATGDVDGDGWLDVIVTQWGAPRLYLNDAGRGWRDMSDTAFCAALEEGAEPDAALQPFDFANTWGTSAALFDHDGDGRLDLYLVHFVDFDPLVVPARASGESKWKGHLVAYGPDGIAAQHDRLLRNVGGGRFVDVTARAKLRAKKAAPGMSVLPLDHDGDGDIDVYVGNHSTPNVLWENRGDGTFEEVAFERGLSHDSNGNEQTSLALASGDLNGDGRPDLFVGNFSGEADSLYFSTKTGAYRERGARSGIGGPSLSRVGWGASLADFDHDEDLDLALFNGHIHPEADAAGTDTSYAQEAQLFVNDGAARFTVEPLHTGAPRSMRASAVGDLDGDGDLDLVAVGVSGQVCVLLNRLEPTPERGWLRVRLRGRAPNTQGVGARVTLEFADGVRRDAWISTAGGFQAALPAEAHFGLGARRNVARVVVRFPNGKQVVREDVAANRVLVIDEEVP